MSRSILRWSLLAVALAGAASCSDSTSPPPVPASVTLVAGDAQTGTVGQPVGAAPRFVVDDASGHAIAGVKVAIAVAAGNGSLTAVPSTTQSGPTSVGTWTLGPRAGVNQLTITVAGLPPITVSATAHPGGAAKVVPVSASAVTARAGEAVVPGVTARVTDAFDNPLAGTTVTVIATTGSAPKNVVSDADGLVTVSGWTVGTTIGQSTLTLSAGTGTTSFIAAVAAGEPANITTVSGDAQGARAGVAVTAPIVVRITDLYGNPVSGQNVDAAIVAGGGSLASATVQSGPDGTATLPAWTLGRSVVPQTLRASAGAASDVLAANVTTGFHIEVRFFGPEMTDEQKALFTNAAARISAVIVGGLQDTPVYELNLARACGLPGLPTLNETIDDIVIYASVQNIDGPKGILAESGPCAFRNPTQGFLTTVGVMLFDGDDLGLMAQTGIMQDVITHEMLHVLGVGTLWTIRSLLQSPGTPSVAFLGTAGRQSCLGAGGTSLCGTSVPVENNGIAGTTDSHWRESIFQSELMTGYVNYNGMPFSAITVGSLADLGYVVNPFAADPYTVPTTPAANNATPTGDTGWERPLPGPGAIIGPKGVPTLIKRP